MNSDDTKLLLQVLNTPTGDALKVEVINKLIPTANLTPRNDPLAKGVLESVFAATKNQTQKPISAPVPPSSPPPPPQPITTGGKVVNRGFLDTTPEEAIKPKQSYPKPDYDSLNAKSTKRAQYRTSPLVKGEAIAEGKYKVDDAIFLDTPRASAFLGYQQSTFRQFVYSQSCTIRRVRIEGEGRTVFYSLEDLREAKG